MSLIRFTMLMHHVSGTTALQQNVPVITSGFSESWLVDQTLIGSTVLNRLQQRRAALLPQNAAIIGQRYGFPDGRSVSETMRYAGTSGESPDIPQMSALCSTFQPAQQSTRRFAIKGIPDSWVQGGILSFTTDVRDPFRLYFQACANAAVAWTCVDVNALSADITSITTDGVLTTATDFDVAVGSRIQLVRAFDDQGNSLQGKARVLTKTGLRTFQLANWTYPNAIVLGSVRLIASTTATMLIDQTRVVRQGSFKVGRPFFVYRGRRSKRKNNRPRIQVVA